MFTKKEILTIVAVIIVLAFCVNLITTLTAFLTTLLAVFLVVFLNIAAKKAISYYYEADIEIMFWEMKRFGFRPGQHFKKPIPIGIILPLVSKIFLYPIKSFFWMAALAFDVKPKPQRAARRHGFYSFYEMTEHEMGIIAAAGILTNLILAAIGYFANFPELARLSMYYAFFNMIPISNLDGNKILFGNIVVWTFLAALTVIGLFLGLFVV
jgi:Zn-dependent protease